MNGGTEFIREFGDTSLPAFESYATRVARTGDIGQWMRTLLPAYKARVAGYDVLFMHADLPEKYRDREVLAGHLRWIDEHMKASTVALGGFEVFDIPSEVHPNAVSGMLDAIEAKFGIPIIYTSTAQDLATERAASWLSKHFTYWWLQQHGLGRVLIDADGL